MLSWGSREPSVIPLAPPRRAWAMFVFESVAVWAALLGGVCHGGGGALSLSEVTSSSLSHFHEPQSFMNPSLSCGGKSILGAPLLDGHLSPRGLNCTQS